MHFHSLNILCSYILNRGWVDKTTQRHPTYAEITTSEPTHKNIKETPVEPPTKDLELQILPEEDLELVEVEDEFDDLADRFESSYNFRFEEP